MSNKNHLQFLEDKLINNFDFKFLEEIKEKLPYHNAYYLVCLVEVLNRFIDEGKHFNSYNNTFKTLITEASELYLSTNISDVFQYYFAD